jgi:2,4-dienoyl-CoA reductase-like NADH-dependent reductase (Old Yellow Enzyme family)
VAHLFSSFNIRSVSIRNRIGVSPMCQYSSEDGFASDWHMVHLGAFATGGAGLVITEAAAVSPEGRISPHDLGIWKDEHIDVLGRINAFVSAHGAVPAIQLAHAGRKASTRRPWERPSGRVAKDEGGWEDVLAPSAVAFADHYPTPRAMTVEEINGTVHDFVAAARRSMDAGFQVIEIHAAHGYLLHTFMSPLSNQRDDAYGGSFENRIRLTVELSGAVRDAIPDGMPLFVRISASDWADGGWTLDESVELARKLKETGVDLIDCSSGGLVPNAKIELGPGYQVPFSERIRHEAGIPTAAVGLITEARQAEQVLAEERADMVLLAREMLRNPRWPLEAAHDLGADGPWPKPYERAKRAR